MDHYRDAGVVVAPDEGQVLALVSDGAFLGSVCVHAAAAGQRDDTQAAERGQHPNPAGKSSLKSLHGVHVPFSVSAAIRAGQASRPVLLPRDVARRSDVTRCLEATQMRGLRDEPAPARVSLVHGGRAARLEEGEKGTMKNHDETRCYRVSSRLAVWLGTGGCLAALASACSGADATELGSEGAAAAQPSPSSGELRIEANTSQQLHGIFSEAGHELEFDLRRSDQGHEITLSAVDGTVLLRAASSSGQEQLQFGGFERPPKGFQTEVSNELIPAPGRRLACEQPARRARPERVPGQTLGCRSIRLYKKR